MRVWDVVYGMYGLNENMFIGKLGRVVVDMESGESEDYWGMGNNYWEGFMMTFKVGPEHMVEG